jgi:LysR family glycine cleavage system transcriptional activator
MAKVLKRRLPPLTSLRGFEAAARHNSFSEAAKELQLSQGAISHQVKKLEAYLGFQLFRRLTRQIELTQAGEDLFQVVQDALDKVEHATSRLKQKSKSKTLVISALPTLSAEWLMPRLYAFTEILSNIELQVVTSIQPADLVNDSIDVAMRVGRLPGRSYKAGLPRIERTMVKDWDGVQADELFPDVLIPVCSPELLKGKKIKKPSDLMRYPLIHTSTRRFAWPDWLRAQGLSDVSESNLKFEFGHFFMSLEAAKRGQGIAIIPQIILSLYKDSHSLVRPLGISIESAGAYYLLIHESKMKLNAVQQFRKWILSEAQIHR